MRERREEGKHKGDFSESGRSKHHFNGGYVEVVCVVASFAAGSESELTTLVWEEDGNRNDERRAMAMGGRGGIENERRIERGRF